MKSFKNLIFIFIVLHILNFILVTNNSNSLKWHILISPESNYFPTIEETIGRINLGINKGKKFIIIGGSSASAGIGQDYENIWSNKLSQILGSDYVVLNSAMNGGTGFEFGFVQARYLAEKGEKVLYIFDSGPIPTNKYDGRWNYIYLSACLKGYDNDINSCINIIKKLFLNKNYNTLFKYITDLLIPHQNLWNFISYNIFQFQYHRYITSDKLFSSRSKYGVLEKNQINGDSCISNKINDSNYLKHELEIVNGYKNFRFPSNGYCNVKEIEENLDFIFKDYPMILKGKTINTISQSAPILHNNQTLINQNLINESWVISSKLRSKYGILGISEMSNEWEDCDFSDRTHWSNSGGLKHAKRVSKIIKNVLLF